MSSELTVLTYNMHKGFSPLGRRFVLAAMRRALAASTAQLAFLQEVQGRHARKARRVPDWPEIGQHEYLAQDHWSDACYGESAAHAAGHHGNAVLSQFPLTGCENFTVSPYPFAASRGILHATVDLPGWNAPLHALCVHFGFVGLERRGQIRRLCRHVAETIPEDAPLIIAGDFNDWTGAAIEASSIGVREAFKELRGAFAKTWPSWAPGFPLDRIYFRGLEPLEARRLTQPPWSRLSDHLPLLARFQL